MAISLFFLLISPLVFSFLSLFTKDLKLIRLFSMASSLVVSASIIYIYSMFFSTEVGIQVVSYEVFTYYTFTFFADGLTMAFLMLIALIMPICYLSIQGSDREKEYLVSLLFLQFCMEGVFVAKDLLTFYVFFESVLIPMFFIVGSLGSRSRRIHAAFLLLLYTIFGSIPMLFSILSIKSTAGTLDFQLLMDYDFGDISYLYWCTFFLAFAVKVPMMPFHIWLPEAHVEAPTAGSVVLAGVLLKLGTYGMVRFCIPLFPEASQFFSPLVILMSGIAVIYASASALRHIDLKKSVAYSSIAHMGVVTLGIFSNNVSSIEGCMFIMFSHGFVASALFLCIGVLYDRYKTRIYTYYSGLVQIMPTFAIIFLFFTMANLALPGTSSFPGELLIMLSAFDSDFVTGLIVTGSAILSSAYSLWMFNRFFYGVSKVDHLHVLSDLTFKEFLCFLPLVAVTLGLGIYPEFLIHLLSPTVADLAHVLIVTY